MSRQREMIVSDSIRLRQLGVHAYQIPTATPEADGTLHWNSTTLVLVELEAGGKRGIGYTYASEAAATLIECTLKDLVLGRNVMNVPGITNELIRQIRNEGNCGIAMMAVSAIDIALWDLKAKILDVPLFALLGKVRDKILLYGSGGFTTYGKDQLQKQITNWVEMGIRNIKIKVGEHPLKDTERVAIASEAAGKQTGLFVDANGAYTVKQALEKIHEFGQYNVNWFEEPVSSDNLEGLRFVREHADCAVNIAAGEYGYHLPYFREMLAAGAVDILQADATRCGGITGFLKAGYLAEAYHIPFSSHCAPSLHVHAALALPSFHIAEYFFDHTRIESMLFDGFLPVRNGFIAPDPSRPGLGLEFRFRDAAKFKL